jgi:hypothetical protein
MRLTQLVICTLLCRQSIVAGATDCFIPLADRLLEDRRLPALLTLLMTVYAVSAMREVGDLGAGWAHRIVRQVVVATAWALGIGYHKYSPSIVSTMAVWLFAVERCVSSWQCQQIAVSSK